MKLKYRVIERFRGKYPIGDMCKVFDVSRSGYYAWRKRQNVQPKDQWLLDLIMECQRESKQSYGFRRVRLWLERHQKHVNSKAILRIMRKYSLLSQVRRTKTYTHYKQAVHKYPNLLDRQFEQDFQTVSYENEYDNGSDYPELLYYKGLKCKRKERKCTLRCTFA